ncbi:MAG: VanZ family protein, partial [Holophagales bacterium]|nr:VanZ family protein [Holophagales bacterium]
MPGRHPTGIFARYTLLPVARYLPYLPFLALAAATVITAPFLGLVRDALFARFGATAVQVLLAGLALVAFAAAVAAVRRAIDAPRGQRSRRLALLVVVAVLLVAQTLWLGSGIAQVDVVEKIHILQYGGMAFLFHRAILVRARQRRDRAGLDHLVLPVLAGTLVGILDESTQGFFQQRTGDIRDVALDGLSALAGLGVALATGPAGRVPDDAGSPAPEAPAKAPGPFRIRCLGAALAATLLALAFFFASFHLGHEIRDPAIGR